MLLFDKLFKATCEIGEKIRNGQWTDNGQSINECEENCKKQSDFIDRAEKSEADKCRKARLKVESGEWFVSRFFRRIIVHMQLLEANEGTDYSVEMDILETELIMT